MARLKSLKLSAVNITTSPHSTADYVRLWKGLYQLRRPVDIGLDQAIIFGSIQLMNSDSEAAGFFGELFRFTVIDLSRPWIDTTSGEEIEEEQLKREVVIPPSYAPNMARFMYRFYPKTHRLIFEQTNVSGHTLGASAVEKLINHLAATSPIAAEFETVDATMVQSEEGIEDIISGRILKKLEITIKRPNPDDAWNSIERAILGEMEEEKVKTKTISLTASTGQSIQPSTRTQNLAKAAATNGHVNAVEETIDGKRVPLSSRQHPRIEPFRYNGATQDRDRAFLSSALEFVRKLNPIREADEGSDDNTAEPPLV